MIKRILLVLVIGVSFAPSVYASSSQLDGLARASARAKAHAAHTGELADVGVGAPQCDLQKTINESEQEIKRDSKGNAGSADVST
jgi:hypothetical protein